MRTLASDELAALDAVLEEAGVAPGNVVFHPELYDLPWRGAEGHARAHGHTDAVDKIRKRQDDTRNAVAIQAGHVVGLRLGRTKLTRLSAFGKFPHLVVLDVHDSQIEDATGLSSLTELDHLDIAGNRVVTLAHIERLPALRSLYAAENGIEHIADLEALPALEVLNLAGNRIGRIEGLSKLTHLRALSLERNPIQRIEGLDANVNLEELNLSYCWIGKIENVTALTKLVRLNLWHNRIVHLEGVQGLSSLRYLGLGENPYDWRDAGNQAIMQTWAVGRLVATL